MSDKLQSVIAELANSVGAETGELWSWMQGDGLRAYATVGALRCWAAVIVFMAMTIASAMYFRKAIRDGHELFDGTYEGPLVLDFVFLTCGLIGAIFTAYMLPDAIGWLVSPEGMVLHKFASAVGM